ncbi:MAG: redox-regulated ATPase YchF [Thermodesulfobacteriota bacterium]
MGFNCGIVGLPNVGKSTIFNAMTAAGAEASNYPFCTIDPNVGMVPLRDVRLQNLADIVKPQRVVPNSVEFVDIAGLVKGASSGEGLGNQFLGNIRSVDTIAHVVRCFEDRDVVHVDGRLDPLSDIETVETELLLADLDGVTKRIEKTEKAAKKGDKKLVAALDAAKSVKACLEEGSPVRGLPEETREAVSDLHLISAKPVLYVANVGEDDLEGSSPGAAAVRERAESEGAGFVVISGKVEAEMAELSAEEQEEFLEGLGMKESGLTRLALQTNKLLGLITYFTAGEKEVRAWTVRKGALAPEAAGVIHTDFERGFIKAEVTAYEDFVSLGGEAECRKKGLTRVEGKEYVVRDGDVIYFKFAV